MGKKNKKKHNKHNNNTQNTDSQIVTVTSESLDNSETVQSDDTSDVFNINETVNTSIASETINTSVVELNSCDELTESLIVLENHIEKIEHNTIDQLTITKPTNDNMSKTFSSISNQLKQTDSKLLLQQKEFDDSLQEKAQLEEKLNYNKQNVTEMTEKINVQNEEIKTLLKQIKSLTENKIELEKNKLADAQVISKYQESIKSEKSHILELEKKLKNIHSIHNDLHSRHNRLENINQSLKDNNKENNDLLQKMYITQDQLTKDIEIHKNIKNEQLKQITDMKNDFAEVKQKHDILLSENSDLKNLINNNETEYKQKYNQLNIDNSVQVAKLQKTKKDLEDKICIKESDIQACQETINKNHEYIAQVENSNAIMKEEELNKANMITALNAEINTKQEEINSIKQDKSVLTNKLSVANQQLELIEQKFVKLKEAKEHEYNNIYQKYQDNQTKTAELQKTISELQNNLKEHFAESKDNANKLIVVQKQALDNNKEIAAKITKIQEQEKKIEDISVSHNSISEKLSKAERELENKNNCINEHKNTINELETTISNNNNKILDTAQEITNKQNKIDELEKIITVKENDNKIVTSTLYALELEKNKLEKDIVVMKECQASKQQQMNNTQEHYNHTLEQLNMHINNFKQIQQDLTDNKIDVYQSQQAMQEYQTQIKSVLDKYNNQLNDIVEFKTWMPELQNDITQKINEYVDETKTVMNTHTQGLLRQLDNMHEDEKLRIVSFYENKLSTINERLSRLELIETEFDNRNSKIKYMDECIKDKISIIDNHNNFLEEKSKNVEKFKLKLQDIQQCIDIYDRINDKNNIDYQTIVKDLNSMKQTRDNLKNQVVKTNKEIDIIINECKKTKGLQIVEKIGGIEDNVKKLCTVLAMQFAYSAGRWLFS